jgi:hypothetical protein
MVLANLLQLAARQGKIFNVLVRPGCETTFRVHAWIGPGMGERLAWTREFPAEYDRMAALDELAAHVIACCGHGDGAEAVLAYGSANE